MSVIDKAEDFYYNIKQKNVDDFWLLRKELFEELGEISQNMDTSELESVTKQNFRYHN